MRFYRARSAEKNEILLCVKHGKKIENYEEAKLAGDFFLSKGVKNSIITLGDMGAYFSNKDKNFSIPALNLKGKVAAFGVKLISKISTCARLLRF